MIQALVRVKILNVYFLIMHQNEQHKNKEKTIWQLYICLAHRLGSGLKGVNAVERATNLTGWDWSGRGGECMLD